MHHQPSTARSWLFAPGDSEKKMTKAMEGDADIVLIDLEDAVAPDAKAAARPMVHDFIAAHPEQRHRLWVRINPLDGPEADKDLAAVLGHHPKGIVLPKAEGGVSVQELTRRLTERGNATAQILAIATETPAAMFQLGSYGGLKRLAGLTWGAEDLPAAIGASMFMFNGAFSSDPTQWEAHMYVAPERLDPWLQNYVIGAGPHKVSYQMLSMHVRANAAVVTTEESGSNKFRKWDKERVTWTLGKSDGQWKVVGFFIRDIRNP